MRKIFVILSVAVVLLSLSISHKPSAEQATVVNGKLSSMETGPTTNMEFVASKKLNTFHRNPSSGEAVGAIPQGLPRELHPYWVYIEEFLDVEKRATPTNGISDEVFSWRMENEDLSPKQIDELRAQWLKSSNIGESPIDAAIRKGHRGHAQNELVEHLGEEKSELFFKWLYGTPMASR